jgi:hypothetical protein
MSAQTTMVNSPKKNFSPLPAGKYGKSTNRSTQRRHQANEGNSGFDAEQDRALGALRSLRSKKKFASEKRQETNFLNNKEKQKWIKDYVERETNVARMQVKDTETSIVQEQEDIRGAESEGMTCGEPSQAFEDMLDAVGDSLSDLVSLDCEEDGEDDHDAEERELSKDNEPGWVTGTISMPAQQRMERFWQK